jgi:glycosyltransferase involved in cell wall biosynthesis
MESSFNGCIVIPVYNHQQGLSIILPKIQEKGWPIILVNDGSSEECKQVLENMAGHPSTQLVNLSCNQGKGAAIKAGMRAALQQQFTHAVQVDADGQHNIEDIEAFFSLGKTYPTAIICGHPIYDESVPKHRFYARYLTHIWVWINSLSFNVKDSMCGFRCYPLENFMSIVDTEYTGNRMDFDSEIMVRWVWRDYKVVNHGTHVSYPLDGLSHFLLWKDNYLITAMHTRLFFGMLWRLPKLIARKLT